MTTGDHSTSEGPSLYVQGGGQNFPQIDFYVNV